MNRNITFYTEKIRSLNIIEFFPKLSLQERMDSCSRIFSRVSRTLQSNVQTFRKTFYHCPGITTLVLGPRKLPNLGTK